MVNTALPLGIWFAGNRGNPGGYGRRTEGSRGRFRPSSLQTDRECTGSHSRGTVRPRFARSFVPLKTEGAGKAGCPMHPQPVCIGSKHTVVTTSTPEITRLSPRNGFNGFLRALPGDEFLFVTVVSRIDGAVHPVGQNLASADLTSATDARTTRLRRTQRPPPLLRQAMCLPKS